MSYKPAVPTDAWKAKHEPQFMFDPLTHKIKRVNKRLAEKFGIPDVVGRGRYKTRRRKVRRHMRGRGLYQGHGGFFSDLADRARSLWSSSAGLRSLAGTAARSGALGPAAMMAGNVAGALGVGDYDVAQAAAVTNDIVDGGQNQGIPSFGSSTPGTICLSHKEYLGDLYAPPNAGFQVTTWSLNPGLVRTFPWLAQVAANYEEYSLRQCILTFRSTVSDFNAGNGQSGTVIVATQYNADDSPLATKQDMLEYDMSMSCKATQNMMHGIECDPAQLSGSSGKYVRDGPVPVGEDLKQYDHGVINVGVANVPSQFFNQSLGEIWISYTIELRKPRFNVTRGFNIARDTYMGVANTAFNSTTQEAWIGQFVGEGQAQQNRIGGKFSSDADASIRYTLPAAFSGYIKATIAIQGYDISGGGTPSATIVPDDDSTGFQRIYDMPGPTYVAGGPKKGWWFARSNALAATASSSEPGWTFCEVHFYVNPVQSATDTVPADNMLIFSTNTGMMINAVDVCVEVYNCAFNTPSSGNAIYGAKGLLTGPPIIVDTNNVPQFLVAPPPASGTPLTDTAPDPGDS